MRVAPAPQPSQTTGEMPAKSTELENASTGAFFAEIDRALNKGGQEENLNEEKTPEQNSETNDTNDLRLFLSACLFAMQPVKTGSGALMDQSVLEQADGESKDHLDAVISANEKAAKLSPSGSMKSKEEMPEIESKENLFANALLSFQPAADFASQNPAMPSAEALSKAGMTRADGENENIKQSGSIFQTILVPKIDSEAATAFEPISIFGAGESESKQTTDSQYLNDKVKISGQEILGDIMGADKDRSRSDTKKQAPVIQESRPESPALVEKMSADRSMNASKTAFLQDSTALRSVDTRADILSKTENAVQEGSGDVDSGVVAVVRGTNETTGMNGSRSDGENGNSAATDLGDSRSERTTGRNESPAWMALQGRLESPAADPDKAKSLMAEHAQDKLAAMAAGFERSAGTNIPSTSTNTVASSRPGEFVYQVADRIQVQLRDGKNEIRIQLKPENLGSLEIRAEATGNGIVARITAESAAVRNYLENNLHVLQQNLQDQGLKVERIQIAVQEVVNQQSSSGQSAQFGHAASGGRQWSDNHKPDKPAADLFSTPTDEIAVDPLTFVTPGSAKRFHTVA